MAAVDDEKVYKQVLLHKGVLDSMRLYLDLSASFLKQLQSAAILTADEVHIISVSILFILFNFFNIIWFCQKSYFNKKYALQNA